MLNNWAQDFKVAFRRFRTAPLSAAFCIVSLSLSIGATTVLYSVVGSITWRAPRIADIDRVVNVYHWNPQWGMATPSNISLARPDYEDLKSAQISFSEMTSWTPLQSRLSLNGAGQTYVGEAVEGNYFSFVGVQPLFGRLIQRADDVPTAPAVAVLSERIWRLHFDADPAIVGHAVHFGKNIVEVVGIAPSRFEGVLAPSVMPTAFWIPLSVFERSFKGSAELDRTHRYLFAKARLNPTVTITTAKAELGMIGRQLDSQYPLEQLSRRAGPSPRASRLWNVLPASQIRVHESVHVYVTGMIAILSLMVTLVLLVAATNIANLQLAQGSSRRNELSIRISLGATRLHVVRALLTEIAVISLISLVSALLIFKLLLLSLAEFVVDMPGGFIVAVRNFQLDLPAVAASLIATCVVFVTSGVVPALRLTNTSLRDDLWTDNPAISTPRWRFRKHLISVQVSISVALCVCAAVCVEQTSTYVSRDQRIDLDQMALVNFNVADDVVDTVALERLTNLIQRASRLTSINDLALASGLPLSSGGVTRVLSAGPSLEDNSSNVIGRVLSCTPEIFRVLRLALIAGRPFTDRDYSGIAPVAVITAATASRLFGRVDVIGHSLSFQEPPGIGEEVPKTAMIIGVVQDFDDGLNDPSKRELLVYVPLSQLFERRLVLASHVRGDPSHAAAELANLTSRSDAGVEVIDAVTGRSLAPAVWPLRVSAVVTASMGLLTLIMSMVGLYGILSYVVRCRTAEIGTRVAMGATRQDVLKLIMKDALKPVVYGLFIAAIGCVVVLLTSRPLLERIFPSVDGTTIIVVPVLFVIIGVVASYLPANRAARIDPIAALRHL